MKQATGLPARAVTRLTLAATLIISAMLAGCSDSNSSNDGIPPDIRLTLLSGAAQIGESAGTVGFSLETTSADSSDRAFNLSIDFLTASSADLSLDQLQLVLAAGDTRVDGSMSIIDDDLPESTEQARLIATLASDPGSSAQVTLDILDDDPLPALPDASISWDHTGVFASAQECGQCHTASQPGDSPAVMRAPNPVTETQPSPEGEDISPLHGWRPSVMANALNDPYFRATMAHETESFPALAGFIEDKCLTCHAPMARTHAHFSGTSLDSTDCPLADGCYRAATAVAQPHAREGVSCTLCHQIQDSVLAADVDSGDYPIADTDTPVIYGPFQSPQGQAMENVSGYPPVYGLQVHSSELCASCHNLFTPTIDVATDLPTGEDFPEQTPYTEWQQSVFAAGGPEEAHCQDCHMGRMDDSFLTRIAVRPNGSVNSGWPERTPFFSHDMVGGNAWLLDLLETFRVELGLEEVSAPGALAAQAQLTRNFLEEAARLDIGPLDYSAGTLSFAIQITNQSGHKLPTSFPARRVWLATRVRDANGSLLFESGFPDANQRLALDQAFTDESCLAPHKPAGFDSSACFQPHVDLVTSASQVPIYETVLAATDGNITHVLLYADEALKDNRIPPRGFDPATAPEEVLPRGVTGDTDFNAAGSGADLVHYQLAPGAGLAEPLQVEAVLYYQSVRPTFVDGLHGEHAWIDQFRSAAAMMPPTVEQIATASASTP